MSRNAPSREDTVMIGTDARPLAVAISPDKAVQQNFDALFFTHYEAVFRLLYRITRTREEAEDLAQETFLRLHRSPQVWDERRREREQNVGGWLYRVATHLAYNALRGRQRRERREGLVLGQALSAGSNEPDPAEVAQRAEEQTIVRRALARLPERQAQLLLLRHAGLSYREVAEALEVAPGSVGTLLARAEAAFEVAYRDVPGKGGGEA
jgi:RNA polymerase sigma-70 factor (ECF subfamily)